MGKKIKNEKMKNSPRFFKGFLYKYHFNLNPIEIWKWPLLFSDFGDGNKTEWLLSCLDNSILSTTNLSAYLHLRLTDISYLHKWVLTKSKLISRCLLDVQMANNILDLQEADL